MTAIVLLIVSTIIGAGFATGAELVAFFGTSGLPPWVIAIIIGVFLFAIMAGLVFLGNSRQHPVVRHVFTAVYFAIFIVMTAGFAQMGGILATLLGLGFCMAVVLFGFEKLLFVNKYLMYFVLAILLHASISNLGKIPSVAPAQVWRTVGSGLVYAGLNCCLLEAVLSKALERERRSRVLASCAIASALIAVLAGLILTAIKSQGITAALPILALSDNFVTRAAVMVCVLTSMFICLFNVSKNTTNRPYFLVLLCLCAFGLSFFGFKDILGVVYPVIGGLMVCYVGCLCGVRCFSRIRRARRLGKHDLFVVDDTIDGLELVKNE